MVPPAKISATRPISRVMRPVWPSSGRGCPTIAPVIGIQSSTKSCRGPQVWAKLGQTLANMSTNSGRCVCKSACWSICGPTHKATLNVGQCGPKRPMLVDVGQSLAQCIPLRPDFFVLGPRYPTRPSLLTRAPRGAAGSNVQRSKLERGPVRVRSSGQTRCNQDYLQGPIRVERHGRGKVQEVKQRNGHTIGTLRPNGIGANPSCIMTSRWRDTR